ncbi:zinc-binding dehydrogenase [Alicyclobacillus fastidiosus]|uniref:Zinc-binding dehydrogenase n=1 Tax=Alicyclobacillus fastidiosus TaxID=392011 RepID=A0ABY6ZMC5_9BACL|nr:zinc-binding dehydrogenase [Alicyclobacillus fastidiosus]WAH44085.1 zinc-binding dehydrogenase [Alicyclobacillus fastidiosus]GMA60378.1 zinc-binding alcohol dehydrogenase [Alicyclobacillus fastidiosus]
MKGKVAVMSQPGSLTLREYDLPDPGPGAVLTEIIRTNVCGSELHIWKGHHPTKKSGVMGHEAIGRIAKLGAGVTSDFAGNPVQVGDRIVAAYYLTCRKCPPCQQGQFHLCENAYKYWSKEAEEAPHFHGTFASHYYIHPDQYFYKVPDNVPDAAAASANCALSQVYFGLEKANLRYGETVVIQGAGGLGLNACAVAKELGATVIVIDALEGRLRHAKDFGADYTINMNEYDTTERRAEVVRSLTGGIGANVGMELTGVTVAFNEGIHLVRAGGRYVSIGNISPGQMTSFDPGLMTRKSIQVIPVVRYDPWYLNKSLKFLERNINKYPFADMLDAEFSFDQIADAMDQSAKRKVTRASIVVGK